MSVASTARIIQIGVHAIKFWKLALRLEVLDFEGVLAD